jgi:hypothetical protein
LDASSMCSLPDDRRFCGMLSTYLHALKSWMNDVHIDSHYTSVTF